MIYQLDPTGISTDNKVINETKVVNPPQKITDASFIVPRVVPFFREGLVVMHGTRTLIENVDYQLVYRSVALSEHFERELFGGIMFMTRSFTGTLTLSYQVLGGDFQTADTTLLEQVARVTGAIRWVTYDQLIGVPSNFPPAYHNHDIETGLVDMGDVVDAVELIAIALGDAPLNQSELSARLTTHLSAEYAHTKAQVGLGSVENIAVASDGDMEIGARKYVTADSLKRTLPALVAANIPEPGEIVYPDLPAQEHQPTTDKITELRKDLTTVNTALTSNGSADTAWRTTHLLTTRDPHPQYVTGTDMSLELSAMLAKIKTLEEKVNSIPPPYVPPAVDTSLDNIKAFWTFQTPVSDTDSAYKVYPQFVPPGPNADDPSSTVNNFARRSVQVTSASVQKDTRRYNQNGDIKMEYTYHLTKVVFKTTFDVDVANMTCLDAYGYHLKITKSGDLFTIIIPRGTVYNTYTPLAITVR